MLDLEITPEAFHALRQHAAAGAAPAPTLLDVREPWEIATASLLAAPPALTALAIPMNEIPARAHTELDPDQPYVVLCHHGARSLSVTSWLRNQGFDAVQSLAGGLDHWSRTIDPTIPRY